MKDNRDPDRQFDENLHTLGRALNADATPSRQTLDRCQAAFDEHAHAEHWRMFTMMKKPALLSITGIAAAIVVSVVLFFPGASTPRVQAATILRHLDEQMAGNPTIELRLDKLSIDNVYIDGFLMLSENSIGGDIDIRVDEDDGPIEINAAMGLREEGSWILIRKLVIPDPEIQPYLMMFFPEGLETVLLLPSDMGDGMSFDIGAGIDDLNSEDLMGVLRDIIASHEDIGAVLETLPDGVIRLTLPIKDAEALESLKAFKPNTMMNMQTNIVISGGTDDMSEEQAKAQLEALKDGGGAVVIADGEEVADISVIEAETETSDDDILIGSTLIAVYDPATEKVRSFAIRDLGGEGSNIEINLMAEEPAADWLDWEKWVTSTPRVLDLGALEGMFNGMSIKVEDE